MRKFTIKIVLFFGLVSVLSVFSYLLNNALIESDPYLVAPDVNTLVIGDSRMQTSLDPKLIPHIANISMSGEPYVATFLKLKEVIKNNPQIKRVVLGISPHNFSTSSDHKFLDDQSARKLFSRYNIIMDQKDLGGIKYDHTAWYILFFNQRVLPNPTYIMNKVKKVLGKESIRYPYIGVFYRSPYSLIGRRAKNDSTIMRHYYENGQVAAVSQKSLSILDSIVEFSRQHNLTLYLFKSPVHPHYMEMIPDKYEYILNKKIGHLVNDKNVMVIDYSMWRLPDDHYGDYDHLNNNGAKIISAEFKKILEKKKEASAVVYPPTLSDIR